jgi:Leucine-rich repeat (LRR) protein
MALCEGLDLGGCSQSLRLPDNMHRTSCVFILCYLLCCIAVAFSDSRREPCFASWSRAQLELYARATWSSHLTPPGELDTAPCSTAPLQSALADDGYDIHGTTEPRSGIAGGVPNEEALQVASDDLTYSTLMTLYESTNGPSWTESWNWGNKSISACQWFGVCCGAVDLDNCTFPNWESGNFTGTCCNPSGVVTTLRLPRNNLQGTMPSSLAQLKNLTNIVFAFNKLTGTVPAEVGQLKALRALELGINMLSGTIPLELTQLSALKILGLPSNQFGGTIPPELGQMSALVEVFLFDNQLIGTIPSELGQLVSLQIFNLHNNQLTGTIPSDFEQLRGLKYFSVGGNQMSGTIPSFLAEFENLENLILHSNQLTGTIPSGLHLLPSLWVLDLSKNMLTGDIPVGFQQLREYHLASNGFSGTISEDIGLMSNLELLDISNNTISGTIPMAIFQMPQLSTLKLAGNQLTGELVTAPYICTPEGLKFTVVDLSFNQLSGTLQFFHYFSKITILNIRHNAFTGPIALPVQKVSGDPCILSDVISVLTLLDVSGNAFTELSLLPSSLTTFAEWLSYFSQ